VEAAHEIPAKGSTDSLNAGTDFTAEDRLAAFEAGRWLGQNERIDIEIEDQVQARLHARTLEALGMAKRSARHGEAFSQLVRESGERDD
jgi:hypothetical protein